MNKDPLKCNECGHFLSYNDLAKGLSSYVMIEADSYFGEETYYGQCVNCKKKEAMDSYKET